METPLGLGLHGVGRHGDTGSVWAATVYETPMADTKVWAYGTPKVIVSDRDTRFTSHFWREVHRLMGTTLAMSLSFRPQTDDEIERVNGSIEEMLGAYVGKRQNDWDERLGMVEFAYNNFVHSSSGYTPFYLCYGRHLVSLVNLVSQMESRNEAANSFLRHLEEDVAQALQNLRRAQDRQKEYVDRRRRDVEF